MRTILATLAALLSGQHRLLEEDAVLEADADVAAEDRAPRDQLGLMPARPEHERAVVPAEQPVDNGLHVHKVLRRGAYPANDPEDDLHEQRRLDDALLENVRELFIGHSSSLNVRAAARARPATSRGRRRS
jgi:hypothetical protein